MREEQRRESKSLQVWQRSQYLEGFMDHFLPRAAQNKTNLRLQDDKESSLGHFPHLKQLEVKEIIWS